MEWKLTYSSPVATGEFSKFAGILSAALSQHHLLGFEMLNWDSIASSSFVHSDAWLLIPGCLAVGQIMINWIMKLFFE